MGAKRNLVVIGNGMSGARTVEEIFARGGAELFNVAMFGDEPFGNYNRILLSAVLDGFGSRAKSFSIRQPGMSRMASACTRPSTPRVSSASRAACSEPTDPRSRTTTSSSRLAAALLFRR